MSKKNLPYFESDAEVAEYLGMGIAEFLKARADGKIGVSQRPQDSTPRYFRSDVAKWLASNRPVQWLTSDPSGVSRKPESEVQNG